MSQDSSSHDTPSQRESTIRRVQEGKNDTPRNQAGQNSVPRNVHPPKPPPTLAPPRPKK